MFQCPQATEDEQPRKCYFREVSQCGDHVSRFICNAHAAMFGLIYRMVNYQDANNDSWSRIETYVSSPASFNIPLFKDRNGEILLSEIYSFALSVENSFPEVRVGRLRDTISCLMGITAYECTTNGWLNDPNTRVIVQDADSVKVTNTLPTLHKLLFYYAKPSLVRNVRNDTHVFLVPNVSLQYDTTNPSVATYHFVIPSKKTMLKWTDRPNCVATSVVLNAVRVTGESQQVRFFKPISTPGTRVC